MVFKSLDISQVLGRGSRSPGMDTLAGLREQVDREERKRQAKRQEKMQMFGLSMQHQQIKEQRQQFDQTHSLRKKELKFKTDQHQLANVSKAIFGQAMNRAQESSLLGKNKHLSSIQKSKEDYDSMVINLDTGALRKLGKNESPNEGETRLDQGAWYGQIELWRKNAGAKLTQLQTLLSFAKSEGDTDRVNALNQEIAKAAARLHGVQDDNLLNIAQRGKTITSNFASADVLENVWVVAQSIPDKPLIDALQSVTEGEVEELNDASFEQLKAAVTLLFDGQLKHLQTEVRAGRQSLLTPIQIEYTPVRNAVTNEQHWQAKITNRPVKDMSKEELLNSGLLTLASKVEALGKIATSKMTWKRSHDLNLLKNAIDRNVWGTGTDVNSKNPQKRIRAQINEVREAISIRNNLNGTWIDTEDKLRQVTNTTFYKDLMNRPEPYLYQRFIAGYEEIQKNKDSIDEAQLTEFETNANEFQRLYERAQAVQDQAHDVVTKQMSVLDSVALNPTLIKYWKEGLSGIESFESLGVGKLFADDNPALMELAAMLKANNPGDTRKIADLLAKRGSKIEAGAAQLTGGARAPKPDSYKQIYTTLLKELGALQEEHRYKGPDTVQSLWADPNKPAVTPAVTPNVQPNVQTVDTTQPWPVGNPYEPYMNQAGTPAVTPNVQTAVTPNVPPTVTPAAFPGNELLGDHDQEGGAVETTDEDEDVLADVLATLKDTPFGQLLGNTKRPMPGELLPGPGYREPVTPVSGIPQPPPMLGDPLSEPAPPGPVTSWGPQLRQGRSVLGSLKSLFDRQHAEDKRSEEVGRALGHPVNWEKHIKTPSNVFSAGPAAALRKKRSRSAPKPSELLKDKLERLVGSSKVSLEFFPSGGWPEFSASKSSEYLREMEDRGYDWETIARMEQSGFSSPHMIGTPDWEAQAQAFIDSEWDF